jgi:hypothetical protein
MVDIGPLAEIVVGVQYVQCVFYVVTVLYLDSIVVLTVKSIVEKMPSISLFSRSMAHRLRTIYLWLLKAHLYNIFLLAVAPPSPSLVGDSTSISP